MSPGAPSSGEPAAAPLAGIRVVDLTRALAGPFATMILADLGADVVKVERPGVGDETRGWGPPWVEEAGGLSAYFVSTNRNKRSVAIDLGTGAGREALGRLVDRADVVISNFRPGVMERFGFGAGAVAARNPRAIVVTIDGYGATGPAAEKPAFDVIVQGESGVMDLTGDPDGPPTRVGITLGDEAAGLYAAQGVLAALYERERTGRARPVEVALHDALLSLTTYHAQGWWASGTPPTRMGNRHPSIVPYQTFRAADGWFNVGVANEAQWGRLCRAVGRPEWIDDPRWATNADRVANRDGLVERLERIFEERAVSEWVAALSEEGVPAGAIRTLPEALDSPEVTERGMVMELEGPAGPFPALAPVVRGTEVPRRPPPALGEHTDEVLAEIGYEANEIRNLRDEGVIG